MIRIFKSFDFYMRSNADGSESKTDFTCTKELRDGEAMVRETITATKENGLYNLNYNAVSTAAVEPNTVRRTLFENHSRNLAQYLKNLQRDTDYKDRIKWAESLFGLAHMFITDPFGTYEETEKKKKKGD